MNFDTSNFSMGLGNNVPSPLVMSHLPAFDPHSMLLKRIIDKKASENEQPIVEPYKEEDVRELEEFCRKHGVLGFNFGRMNPKAALRMLKGKMGIVEQPTQVSQKTLLKG